MDVLSTDSTSWDSFLSALPENLIDIYFTAGYHKLYETNGGGTGQCFLYSDRDGMALYPFMINQIDHPCLNGTYFDVETAYGYGGPVATTTGYAFLDRFESAWLDYCQARRIIAEFVRFHPLIANQGLFRQKINVSYNRTTAFIDLTKGADRVWQEEISSKNRNMIRKAMTSGVHVEVTEDWEAFKGLYCKTMKRLQAEDYYFFSDEYFRQMKYDPAYILLGAFKDGMMISGAIFMQYGQYFHYHLAGSDTDSLKYAPNNLLMWEAIKLAIDKGAGILHLGGGRTVQQEDSLLKYKSSFTKNFLNFYIGKRVHNTDIYCKLIDSWQKEHQRTAGLFLQYRMP